MTRRLFLLTPALASFRPLMNGRDLTGWRHAAHAQWTVEDGAFVGRFDHAKPGPGYLMSEEQFGDFVLRLEYWVSSHGNSGVYVREMPRAWGPKGDERPGHGAGAGVEIQIDYHDPKNLTGSFYNVQKSTRLAGAEERWNRMEIECRGSLAVVRIEGEEVNRYASLPNARGVIGFQSHGGQPHHHVVKFRRIEIQTL
jgi:hypothetical protein